MTPGHQLDSHERIEATRRVCRRAAETCGERGGATVEEQAIGLAYAAFDLAERQAGPGVSAIEWLRTACDVMEQGVMDGRARR